MDGISWLISATGDQVSDGDQECRIFSRCGRVDLTTKAEIRCTGQTRGSLISNLARLATHRCPCAETPQLNGHATREVQWPPGPPIDSRKSLRPTEDGQGSSSQSKSFESSGGPAACSTDTGCLGSLFSQPWAAWSLLGTTKVLQGRSSNSILLTSFIIRRVALIATPVPRHPLTGYAIMTFASVLLLGAGLTFRPVAPSIQLLLSLATPLDANAVAGFCELSRSLGGYAIQGNVSTYVGILQLTSTQCESARG